uniref:competence protein CoiA family protein n=1 Tax=Herbidospora sakaeratensis TaxID=564415 RepID=UPI000B01565C|nr:competence protein CoiA family protein [Herbidospora sakaeratensis]
MTDKRKVQTAVLSSPESHEPILMPFERVDAILLRSKYSAKRFFCGVWLGGCGRELYTRIGSSRVPHFAHHPEGSDLPITCKRASNDEASADHLYIRRALVEWLKRHGHRVKAVMLEGTVPRQGGTCTGMTITTTAGLLIAVALRDDLRRDPQRYWPRRDDEHRRGRKRVEWLFGPHVTLAKQMIKRTGHAFTVDCRNDGLHRTVQIGLKVGGKIPLYADLADCKLDEKGHLWTPPLAELLRQKNSQDADAVVTTPPPAIERQTEMAVTGFPLSVSLLTVVPRVAEGRVIEAEISCPVAALPADVVRVRLPQAAIGVSVGRPYQVVAPALVVAESHSGGRDLTWTIHAQDLSPLFHDEPEVKAVEKQKPQPSAWDRATVMITELRRARLALDRAASARVRAALQELIPELTPRQQIQAKKQMSMYGGAYGPQVTPKLAKKPPTDVSRTGSSKKEKKTLQEVHRNQASILFEMIKRADAQGKHREAKELREALSRFLAGLPEGEYQEQLDQLARYRGQLPGDGRRRGGSNQPPGPVPEIRWSDRKGG